MQNITLEHPEYSAKRAMWRKYKDLYIGGEQMKTNASEYLSPRQKEPMDVYAERLDKVFYENYVGSIIDWYAATLFRREAVLHIDGASQTGRRFFNTLSEDCDLKGSNLSDFFRRRIVDSLVFGSSLILVDFPRTTVALESRAAEDENGASRAYLVDYTPENLVNWSYDEHGNFNWIVLRTSELKKESVEADGWTEETRWFYYDKQNYRTYRMRNARDRESPIELVDQGLHGLARLSRVPLFEMKVSDGLWLMNKAGLVQLEHFNKSNALSWALTMGLFAVPVIYSERDWNQVVGESYYIQLAPGDKFGWTEPEGKVFEIAGHNLQRLQQEIYRVCYLLTQSRDGAAQSGLSKLRDFAITQEVLRGYGDMVKDTLKRVLRSIGAAREDGLSIDVSGLDDFDIGDFAGDLEDARQLLSLGIESRTLRVQLYKRLAQKYLCDVRQELKDQIALEIEASAGRK